MSNKKTIAVDFDGVIHRYSRGWYDGSIYDPPIDGAIEGINRLRTKFNVVIFTARKDVNQVARWFMDHFGGWMPEVTNIKPVAVAYIDDRAIRFESWDQILNSKILRDIINYD